MSTRSLSVSSSPCLQLQGFGSMHCHVPPLASSEVLVISKHPLLVCQRKATLPWKCSLWRQLWWLHLGRLVHLFLLWITETRPLIFIWSLSTSNQLVLVFGISWEPGQEAFIYLLFLKFTLKSPLPFQCCSLPSWPVSFTTYTKLCSMLWVGVSFLV